MAQISPIRFQYESTIDAPVGQLWGFYMAPDALARLTPPLSGFRVVDVGDGVADGSVLEASVGLWPASARWRALHAAVRPEESFVDIAIESPFRYWLHLHRFEAVGRSRSRLIDVIWFVPPRGVPRWAGRLFASVVLRGMFWWRHRATRRGLRGRARSAARWFGMTCGNAAPGGTT